jgi:cobalt-precorrin 5A hydrolase
VGARAGVPQAELDQAIERTLAAASRHRTEVAALATLDRRAAEPGPRAVAERNGWDLLAFTAVELAAVDAARPSESVRARAGTPSVAEAAALRAAGPDGVLIAKKRVFPRVTVAIADRVPAYPERS